jgi:MSHA biogenesis protein MshN
MANRDSASSSFKARAISPPDNGMWWTGLGTSLQAERRNAEACNAFMRARQAGLTPELQAFVERKLGQVE